MPRNGVLRWEGHMAKLDLNFLMQAVIVVVNEIVAYKLNYLGFNNLKLNKVFISMEDFVVKELYKFLSFIHPCGVVPSVVLNLYYPVSDQRTGTFGCSYLCPSQHEACTWPGTWS